MNSPEAITKKLAEYFPEHPLRVNSGRSLTFLQNTFLVIAALGIFGAIYNRNAEDVFKYYAITGAALVFLAALMITNFKRFRLIYTFNRKNLTLGLIPITSTVTRKSIRGNTVTYVTYNWPQNSQSKVNRAEFSGEEGPLIIPTSDKTNRYALAIIASRNSTKPYLMDKRLARCNLTQSERRKLLKEIRKQIKNGGSGVDQLMEETRGD